MFRRNDKGGDAPGPNVYQMKQKMLSIGDDFWIENGAGQRVFKVDGKALRIRKTLHLQDAAGNDRYLIKEKLVYRPRRHDHRDRGRPVATVKKALISPLRERYNVELAAGGEWKVQGNIVDHAVRDRGPGRQDRRGRQEAGSASATRTASRSRRARTTRWCWPSRSSSTRCPTPTR